MRTSQDKERFQPGRQLTAALSFHARVLCELQVIRCTRSQPVRGSLEHFYASNVSDNELVSAILTGTEGDDRPLSRSL